MKMFGTIEWDIHQRLTKEEVENIINRNIIEREPGKWGTENLIDVIIE